MNEFKEYEQETIDYIADKILEYKYKETEKKFNSKMEQGFYNTENILDMINFLPEAFFTDFKKVRNEDEIYEIILAADLFGDNGFLYTEDGDRAKADKVFEKLTDPDVCQAMTERYMLKNLGEYHFKRFKTNFENQKEIAFEAFAHYFLQNDKKPNFKDIEKMTNEDLNKAITLTLVDTNARVSFIKSEKPEKLTLKYGDTFNMAIARITDTDNNVITKSASFGTLAPFKHYMLFDKYKDKVNKRMEILPEVRRAIIDEEYEKTIGFIKNKETKLKNKLKM